MTAWLWNLRVAQPRGDLYKPILPQLPGDKGQFLLFLPMTTQLSFPASSDQLLPQSEACPLGVCLGQYLSPEAAALPSCSDPASGGSSEVEA